MTPKTNRKFVLQVAHRTAFGFVWYFFSVYTFYLFHIRFPHFLSPSGLFSWLMLCVGAYSFVWLGMVVVSLVAPSTWGTLAPTSYGKAMLHYADQEGLLDEVEPVSMTATPAEGQDIIQALQAITAVLCQTVHQKYTLTLPHLFKSSAPFLLFQQAPLRIP